MGRVLATAVMALLQHCPARAAPSTAAASASGSLTSAPTHSLWLLESHVRRSWLLSLLVLLYKVHSLTIFYSKCWFSVPQLQGQAKSGSISSLFDGMRYAYWWRSERLKIYGGWFQYHYTQQPYCTQVTALLRIVLNTLSAQHHVCRRVPSAIIVGSVPSRSRGKFSSSKKIQIGWVCKLKRRWGEIFAFSMYLCKWTVEQDVGVSAGSKPNLN